VISTSRGRNRLLVVVENEAGANGMITELLLRWGWPAKQKRNVPMEREAAKEECRQWSKSRTAARAIA